MKETTYKEAIAFKLDEVIKLNKKGIIRFVYILTKNDDIIYIGKSKGGLLGRIGSHLKTKDFDDVSYVSARTDSELSSIEKQLIKKHKPKLNVIYKNHSSEYIDDIIKISNRRIKTRVKVNKILEIDCNMSSSAISDIIGISTRSVERYKKCRIK